MRKIYQAFLVLIFCCLILSCSKPAEQPAPASEGQQGVTTESSQPSGKVIASADGITQITVVGGWDKAKGLHKKAKLQASNPFKEMFVVVFSEKKDMFPDMTLEEHSKETLNNLMETMTAPYSRPTVQLTLDGNKALMNEIRGMAGNMKIVYLHLNVETPFYFHEILAWTPDSKFKQNRYTLENIVKTFKEAKAAPAAGSTP